MKSMATSIPEDIATRLMAGIREIRVSGLVPGLAVGDRAPDFTLADAQGVPFTLSKILTSGPVILTFYRGDWCPFCNVQLRHLERALPKVLRMNATLVAVSPQSPDHAVTLTEKHVLTFPVLLDVGQEIARAYRVRFALTSGIDDLLENVSQNDPGPSECKRFEVSVRSGDFRDRHRGCRSVRLRRSRLARSRRARRHRIRARGFVVTSIASSGQARSLSSDFRWPSVEVHAQGPGPE